MSQSFCYSLCNRYINISPIYTINTRASSDQSSYKPAARGNGFQLSPGARRNKEQQQSYKKIKRTLTICILILLFRPALSSWKEKHGEVRYYQEHVNLRLHTLTKCLI